MQARIHHPRDDADGQPRFLHISWLYAQDYCEYQLYLDQVKGVEVDDTPAMLEGSAEHQRLEMNSWRGLKQSTRLKKL